MKMNMTWQGPVIKSLRKMERKNKNRAGSEPARQTNRVKNCQQLLGISFTTIFFQEFLNPTSSINKFLFAGEKRMAG